MIASGKKSKLRQSAIPDKQASLGAGSPQQPCPRRCKLVAVDDRTDDKSTLEDTVFSDGELVFTNHSGAADPSNTNSSTTPTSATYQIGA